MYELIKDFGLKAAAFIVPWFVRWFYKAEKIDKAIKIKIRGEGDGIVWSGGEIPNVRAWLSISNFSPFEIEVDRIYGQFVFGSTIGEFSELRRFVIPPAEERDVLVELTLNNLQLTHILKNKDKADSKIYLGSYVITRLHSLELHRDVSTNNVRFLNCNP